MLIFKVYFFLLRTEMQKKKSKKKSLFTKYMYIIRYWYTELHNRKAKKHWEFLYMKINDLDIKKCWHHLCIHNSYSCYKLIFFLTGRILSIAWNTSLEVILTGGVDNMRLWSVKSGHAVQRMTLGRVEKSKETIVWCVAILRYCMKKGKLNMVM